MNKLYSVYLDNKKIGSTQFEKADAAMGVVFGIISFDESNMGYDFIKNYCRSKNIELSDDFPDDKLIATRTIESLTVKNELGIEIKGVGNQINGMDDDGFEIILEGIPYPFYEEEFPHHVNNYNNQFTQK